MPQEYTRDGDNGFIGLNSRDNPASLPAGMVSKSQNFRLDRGVATVRKGLKRLTSTNILNKTIYGVSTYINGSGQEIFAIVVTNGVHTFNPETETFSTLIAFPTGETITTQIGCDVVTAVDKIFISRGHSKRPLICTIDTTTYTISGIIAAQTVGGTGTYAQFPNCSGLLYYANRMIAIGKHHSEGYTFSARSRDSVSVSNYLDFTEWALSDVFTFNEGGNDEVVSIAPWTLNEFIVFMKNSIFYVSVGTGIYLDSATLNSSAYMKNLVSDIGCNAKNSVVLAGGGVIFLSESGVYVMNPTQVGSNESMRLLTSSDPLSSPIDDVIQRINKAYIEYSVGIYYNNRYYLAVPLDNSVDNNCVLVYNFILKNWESVDTYPSYSANLSYQVNRTGSLYNVIYSKTKTGLTLNQFFNVSNVSGGEIAAGKYQVASLDSTWGNVDIYNTATVPLITASYTVSGSGYPYTINVTTSTPHGITPTTSLDDYPYYGSGYVPSPTLYITTSPSKWTDGRKNIVITGETTFTFKVTSGFVSGTTSGSLVYSLAYGRLDLNFGFDIVKFGIAKKSNSRRLFGFDTAEGVFLMDELDYDEYGQSTGTPVLPFIIPQTLNPATYTPNQIQGELKTRLYTYNQLKDKRFSTIEVDILANQSSQMSTYIETINPDTTTLVDFYGSPTTEDSTRRLAVRKIGYGLQARFTTNSLRTSIRGVNLTATVMGKQNISKK
ncbi:hypothetical protein CCP3SC1AL1_400012 [Gammaproteobacteria bacterium]